MRLGRAFALYLRSGLNKVVGAAALIVALAGLFAVRGPWRVALVVGSLLSYALATFLLVQSRRGAEEIVRESEEEQERSTLEKLRETRSVRERIGMLRLGDPEVRKAVEYFLLVSGQYLEHAVRARSRSPRADEAVREVLETLQIYLEGLDGASVAQEYRTAEPAAIRDSRELGERQTIERIRAAAELVSESMGTDLGLMSARERMGVIREMEARGPQGKESTS